MTKTRLSVNINKVALIRNARGSNYPNLIEFAKDCERFGAEGITVHPRPDERHIRYDDVRQLAKIVTTEFNVEGFPNPEFMQLVKEVKPEQVTLVPDDPDALTSDHGWDTIGKEVFLSNIISELHAENIRVSLFIDPIEQLIEGAAKLHADRIELYTGPYAMNYKENKDHSITKYANSARFASSLGLGINAGHDLNLHNLKYFKAHVDHLLEVSIGHALVVDSLYYGLENVINMYKDRLIEST